MSQRPQNIRILEAERDTIRAERDALGINLNELKGKYTEISDALEDSQTELFRLKENLSNLVSNMPKRPDFSDCNESDLVAEIVRRQLADELSDEAIEVLTGIFFEQDAKEHFALGDIVQLIVSERLSEKALYILRTAVSC
jgi:predicted nuclease with TOPRIM domain